MILAGNKKALYPAKESFLDNKKGLSIREHMCRMTGTGRRMDWRQKSKGEKDDE